MPTPEPAEGRALLDAATRKHVCEFREVVSYHHTHSMVRHICNGCASNERARDAWDKWLANNLPALLDLAEQVAALTAERDRLQAAMDRAVHMIDVGDVLHALTILRAALEGEQ